MAGANASPPDAASGTDEGKANDVKPQPQFHTSSNTNTSSNTTTNLHLPQAHKLKGESNYAN